MTPAKELENDWGLFAFFFFLCNLTIIIESLLPINFMRRIYSDGKQLKNTVCIYAMMSRINVSSLLAF